MKWKGKKVNMKKLYQALAQQEVLFLSSTTESSLLQEEGEKWFREQEAYGPFKNKTSVSEIVSFNEVPTDWRKSGTLLWGTNEEITAEQFLQQKYDPDYQEYLRLKEKFE